MPLLDPIETAALRTLRRHLGLFRAIRLGVQIRARVARGAPFEGFPLATDDKERGSRAQLGPAIVLYRLLREQGCEAARQVVADVVHDGALAFLASAVGPIEQKTLQALSSREREQYLSAIGDRFPNATLRFEKTDSDAVQFRVTSCRFVSLCRELGEPDLAPIFCAGDATYFGHVEPGVSLHRPETLAAGDDSCLFSLTWSSPP
jgi:predicted ArsR family transcriptional regulator